MLILFSFVSFWVLSPRDETGPEQWNGFGFLCIVCRQTGVLHAHRWAGLTHDITCYLSSSLSSCSCTKSLPWGGGLEWHGGLKWRLGEDYFTGRETAKNNRERERARALWCSSLAALFLLLFVQVLSPYGRLSATNWTKFILWQREEHWKLVFLLQVKPKIKHVCWNFTIKHRKVEGNSKWK